MADPITAAQEHVWRHAKLIADTLYEVQQMPVAAVKPDGEGPRKVAELSAALGASAAKLDALLEAIPEYPLDKAKVVAALQRGAGTLLSSAEALEAQAAAIARQELEATRAVFAALPLAAGIAVKEAAGPDGGNSGSR